MSSLSIFIGLRYTLARRRNRSVSFISGIAMIGIVLGVALLITVLSVMNGFDKELKERILSIMPQISLYQRGGLEDWPRLREQVLEQDQIVGATPFVEMQVMLHEGKRTQPALLYGLSHEYESTVSTIDRYLSPDVLQTLSKTASHVALGRGLAEKLGLQKGDAVTVIVPSGNSTSKPPSIKRLLLIDIFETGTELDHTLAIMGLDHAAALNSGGRGTGISGLHIKVDQLFAAPRIAAFLKSQLPLGFYTDDWTRTHGNIYYAIKMSKNLVSLLLFLIVAIAAFNVVSTLVMVVVDKQGDIAILRTLGLSQSQITHVFIVQGAVIGVIGTLIGVMVGVALALSVEHLVAGLERMLDVRFLESDIYPVSFLPSSLALQDVIFVASVALVMSVLATIYPAKKAAKVEPAKALRYD